MSEQSDVFENHRVWVEITKRDHDHGGPGWEFGTCLWSPTRNRAGADRYAVMRIPTKGDRVLHFLDDVWPDGTKETRLCGESIVENPAYETTSPPNPGDWAGFDSYYRIDLSKYESLARPVSLKRLTSEHQNAIRREIDSGRPKYYPFNTYGDGIRTVQGIYLARCTPQLEELISDLAQPDLNTLSLDSTNAKPLPDATVSQTPLFKPRKHRERARHEDQAPDSTSTRKPRRSKNAYIIGRRGEELVLNHLSDQTASQGVTEIRWIADQHLFPGYDIEYRDTNGILIGVEVKATTAGAFTSFELTANEMNCAELMGANYHLYLVANCNSAHPTIQIIENPAGLISDGKLAARPERWLVEHS